MSNRSRALKIRDNVLDTLKTPEHYKRFAQYLTGGVEGDVVTELPDEILQDVIGEHVRGAYPDRDQKIPHPNIQQLEDDAKAAGDEEKWNSIVHGMGGFIDNPAYDPKSTLLSTYGSGYTGSKRTLGSLGHINFVPQKDEAGNLIGYRIKDTWDVDPDSNYKPWKSPHHPDLIEGGVVAARLHDASSALKIAKPFKYDVFIPIDKFKSIENKIKTTSQFKLAQEVPREDKRPPHKLKPNKIGSL